MFTIYSQSYCYKISYGNNVEFNTQHLDGITVQSYSYELISLYSLLHIFPD